MSSSFGDNSRIAKNTLLLYFRTFITIVVALYTSRVVLSTLGEVDYGVYNIVGGVVILFSFIQNAMATATQRFLNFEMGCGDDKSVNRVFSASMTVYIVIALFILILSETVGLWFVNNKLNIPADRVVAAHWVYQFSIFTTCANIVRIPYHATIIANEKMSFYAYISIVESVLNLLIVYVLLIISTDKLILYSCLMLSVKAVVTLCYKIYCNRAFSVSRYHMFWDKGIYSKLVSFSGWSLLGSSATVGATQSINILLNLFYGVVINAAMGIANQVQVAISSLITSFQTAFSPQLVKAYAAGEYKYFVTLLMQASKYSFFLSFIVILPLIICSEQVLMLWLGDVPKYSIQFTQLILIYQLIDSISLPTWFGINATGNIKRYQIAVSILLLINIPISYLLLKLGFSPFVPVAIRVLINLFVFLLRVFYLNTLVRLPISRFVKEVLLYSLAVVIISSPLPIIVNINTQGVLSLFATVVTSIICVGVAIFMVGMTKVERDKIISLITSKF